MKRLGETHRERGAQPPDRLIKPGSNNFLRPEDGPQSRRRAIEEGLVELGAIAGLLGLGAAAGAIWAVVERSL